MKIGDRTVEVSRADKVFFPDAGVTKGEVAEHYARTAELAVRLLANRPIAVRRFPDGIGGQGFFQKNARDHYPDWVRREQIDKREGGQLDHVVLDDPATLVYLADQGAVEVHAWLSAWPDLDEPVEAVFDLDPPGGDAARVRRAARAVRDVLAGVGVATRVKTTGSKGFHVHVPLAADQGFDAVRAACQTVAERAADAQPDLLTTAQRKHRRGDRVFIDVGRNAYGQTAVAPYSVRARPGAPVAVPLPWDAVEGTAPDRYTMEGVRRRLAQTTDPWLDDGLGPQPLVAAFGS